MNKEEYFKLVKNCTSKPISDKTKWAKYSKLCLLYIEPRPLNIVKYNLWNLCNIYGGCDACLTIIHSSKNKEDIMEITKDWENVKYIQKDEELSSVDNYSRLLTTYDFWNTFSEYDHVLINQWDSYLFKKIPDNFFQYDFVGAPTGHFYIPFRNGIMNICGMKCKCDRCIIGDHYFKEINFINNKDKIFMFNGGLSLRKTSVMKQICNIKPYKGEAEDLYFCLSGIHKPSRDEAKEFSVQDFKYDDKPVGCHQIWLSQSEEYISKLFM